MSADSWEKLLCQVGPAHHEAFAAADGDDPDWPSWYAGWLLERLPAGQRPLDQTELAGLLAAAADAHQASESTEDWPGFYARFVSQRLQG